MNVTRPRSYVALKIVKFFIYSFTALILLIIAAVFCFGVYRWFVPPGIIVQADAGFKRAQKTIDPEKLRAWALESIKRWPDTNGSHAVPDAEVPGYIKNLYSYPPEQVFVNENRLTILWGGGILGWGFEIGDTNFFEPFKTGNPEYPYNFEWVNGIYYIRGGNWKLQ